MENVIAGHFPSIDIFRNFNLIFNLEPFFIKTNKEILFFDKLVFDIHSIIINGKKEGLWISWYDNGQKEVEGNYRNGKEEGLWIYWHQNGQKESEGNYLNGEKEGLWIY